MNKTNAQNVEVYGLPRGDILIKSKFNEKGIVRSFDDLIWAIKTFQFENPCVGIIGLFVKNYFKKNKAIRYFEEKNLIKIMLKVLQENLKNKSKQSLLNLKLSITSGKLNGKEIDESNGNRFIRCLNKGWERFDLATSCRFSATSIRI